MKPHSTTPFPVYGADEVCSLLDYPGCIAAVREAMASFTADGTAQPLRHIIPIAPERLFGLMPGFLAAPHGFGAKIITAYEDPARPGRSEHRGVVILFDRQSSNVACVADGGAITLIRTGAASAVATDALARRDASRLAVFGTGAQAASHIRALSCVRELSDIVVWGRSFEAAAAFAARMGAETGRRLRAVASAAEAAQNADIICTVTGSRTPVLRGEWVRPGTHVNVVGSSYAGPVEVDDALVVGSRYVVDSRRSALAAAAEFLNAKASGLVTDEHIVAEIGEVLLGRIPGRTSDVQITLYKSLGHVVQDLAATTYVHARATQRHVQS